MERHVHGLEDNTVNRSILLKVILSLSLIPNEVPGFCLFVLQKQEKFLNPTGILKGSQIVKTILRKKNLTGALALPDFKIHYTKLQ